MLIGKQTVYVLSNLFEGFSILETITRVSHPFGHPRAKIWALLLATPGIDQDPVHFTAQLIQVEKSYVICPLSIITRVRSGA